MIEKVLVDTSAWIDHLKGATDSVAELLRNEAVVLVSHPMVTAELALGGLRGDCSFMRGMKEQASLRGVRDDELLEFIDKQGISGKGIGYVDANLLASCVLDGARLLTHDRRLREVAAEIAVGLTP